MTADSFALAANGAHSHLRKPSPAPEGVSTSTKQRLRRPEQGAEHLIHQKCGRALQGYTGLSSTWQDSGDDNLQRHAASFRPTSVYTSASLGRWMSATDTP